MITCVILFKEKAQEILFSISTEEDYYVDVPIIIKRIKKQWNRNWRD